MSVAAEGPEDVGGARTARTHRVVRASLLVAALLVAASLVVPFLEDGTTYELVFGPGAAEAADQGEVFEVLPHRRIDDVIWLELEPGDSLLVRNLDDELHQVAGIAARPGESVLHTFRERGVFSDVCSLDVTVFVEVGRR